MLHDLDETIKQLLLKAGRFEPGEVEISFDIPNREWSKQNSKPTLNCYLFDVHERRALREEGWRTEDRGRPTAARRPPPLFYEITYLITAWTTKIEDEHRLLWDVLDVLARYPVLNDPKTMIEDDLAEQQGTQEPITTCLFGELERYPFPMTTTVAQLEGVLRSPGEFWTALENHLKPSLSYVVTLALDRQARRAGPPILSTGLRIHLPEATAEQGFMLGAIFQLPPNTPRGNVAVLVEETGTSFITDDHGHVELHDVAPGRYTLRIETGGQIYRRVVTISDPRPARTGFSEQVLDQNGKPLAGVEVEVERLGIRTVTDTDGKFSLPGIPPGRYMVRLQMDGWFQRRPITIVQEGYRLTLAYGGRLNNDKEIG